MRRTLVLGGSRSGKSAHAEGLLSGTEPALYLATGRRPEDDDEWRLRIDAHAARRPLAWRTIETTDPASVLMAARADGPPLLLDDVATWLSGLLDDTGAWDGGTRELAAARLRADRLVTAVACCPARLVLVSAEVGLGVVPATRSGRLFRDELGIVNARLAHLCDEVLLLVAGIPMRLR